MGAYPTIRLSDDVPAAPSGKRNVVFQSAPSVHNATQVNVTAYVDEVTEDQISLSDVTTDNVSTSAHGFAPKLPNDATKYLDGTGAYSVPGGGGGSTLQLGTFGTICWNASASTPTQIGCVFETINGTFGLGNGAASSTVVCNYFVTSTSGDYCLVHDQNKQLTTTFLARLQFALALSSTGTGRVWFGMADSFGGNYESNTPSSVSLLGFRFSAGTDTNFQCAALAAGSLTLVDSGVAADTAFHQFRVDMVSGDAKFYIDGNLVGTIVAADLPGNNLGCWLFLQPDNGMVIKLNAMSQWLNV